MPTGESYIAFCSSHQFWRRAYPCLSLEWKILFIAVLTLSSTSSLFPQNATGGIVWYPAIQLSDDTHQAYEPKIALSGDDTVHVIWSEDYGGIRLPYIRSVTGGSAFESVRELLTDTIPSPERTFRSAVVANKQNVFLFFTNVTTSPVRMLASTDGGTTFGTIKDITTDQSSEITWATNSGNTLALIYPMTNGWRRILGSSDGGNLWTRANEDLGYFDRIALTQSALHHVKHAAIFDAAETEYQRSTNLGNSWDVDIVLSQADSIFSAVPTIAAVDTKCGTSILTAWRDEKFGCMGILGCSIISRAGLANGKTWLPELLMTDRPIGSEPRAAMNSKIRALTWWHEVAPYESLHVAIRASNNSITNYCPIKDITPDSTTSGPPQIAVSSHAVHVVWEENVGGSLGTERIFYRRGEFLPSHAVFSLGTGLVEFDTTEVNTTTTDTVLVNNTGSDPLVIGSALSDDPNFSVSPASQVIPPGGSASFVVSFTPVSSGAQGGKIIFFHDGDSSPDCFAVAGVGKWNRTSVSYRGGRWNMVSIPFIPGYVQKLPSMFSYEGHYIRRDTMVYGRGYWAKPDSVVTYEGANVPTDTVTLRIGWNMIGTLWKEVARTDVMTMPDSIIISHLFGFDGAAYIFADTLYPGKAYWVKAKQAGKLILK